MSHASKTCTEKKIRLKSLIKALTKEDIDGNMASDMEEESGEKDENVDSDDATDEETYVGSDIWYVLIIAYVLFCGSCPAYLSAFNAYGL